MKTEIRELTTGFCVILPVILKPKLNNIKSARLKDIFYCELWYEIYVKSHAKAVRVIGESGVVTQRHDNYPAFYSL